MFYYFLNDVFVSLSFSYSMEDNWTEISIVCPLCHDPFLRKETQHLLGFCSPPPSFQPGLNTKPTTETVLSPTSPPPPLPSLSNCFLFLFLSLHSITSFPYFSSTNTTTLPLQPPVLLLFLYLLSSQVTSFFSSSSPDATFTSFPFDERPCKTPE